MEQNLTHPTRAEYWADGVVHIGGVLFALLAALWLATTALTHSVNNFAIPVLAYCFGLTATFVFSAAYNMSIKPGPKAVLRKIDRAAIFLMIAGTYTPLGLFGVGGNWGIILVIANWLMAIIGVVATLFFAKRFENVSLAMYLTQGGLMLVVLKPLFEGLSSFAFFMILLGALTYAAGVIFYRRDDWKYNRAIWHIFVLSAAIIHYVAILDIVNFA